MKPAGDDRHEVCGNCTTPLAGPYCHACGQARAQRLDLPGLLVQLRERVLNLDAGFLRTFWGLWRHPGRVCREFVEGARRRYTHPLTYVVVAVAADLLVRLMLAPPLPAGAAPVVELSATHPLLATFVVLLPLPILWRWLFRETGYNVAEAAVLALYWYAQISWLGVGFSLLAPVMPSPYVGTLAWTTISLGLLLYAAIPFFGCGGLRTVFRLGVSLVAGLALSVVGLVVLAIIMPEWFMSAG